MKAEPNTRTAEATATPLQVRVDRWLLANAEEIHSFEGTLTEAGYAAGDLAGWLPGYNHGVYILGEYVCSTSDCEGCGTTAFGYRTCVPRIKIGRAADMYMRLAGIKTGTSHELEVLALMPFADARTVERQLHDLFRPQRIINGRRSEWFWHCEELESLIVEATSYGAEYASPR